jgi:hypothetical protein
MVDEDGEECERPEQIEARIAMVLHAKAIR